MQVRWVWAFLKVSFSFLFFSIRFLFLFSLFFLPGEKLSGVLGGLSANHIWMFPSRGFILRRVCFNFSCMSDFEKVFLTKGPQRNISCGVFTTHHMRKQKIK